VRHPLNERRRNPAGLVRLTCNNQKEEEEEEAEEEDAGTEELYYLHARK
jgi:hypothetical protein